MIRIVAPSSPIIFLLLVASVAYSETKRPNVIVILADDQGWGDVSLHDNPDLSTPNIDSLAHQGAQIKNFYVCAVCSPTRAEFLTGRYHTRMGVYSTSAGGERFAASEQTIAQVFQAAGYKTAAYGKWHSGMQYPYHPNARGFEDYYGFCSGHWGNYWDPMLEHNGRIVKGEGFIVDDLTNHAIDFISKNKEESFFVYLPLNTPHSPMQVPDKYWERFKDKEITPDPEPANQKKQNIEHTRAALAMCENIDDNVGRILKHLQSMGLDRETIVVYFSDNGPNGSRFNGGLRGKKGATYEGGLRSVCVIRYPAQIAPGTTVKQVGGAIDLLPTLAEFAGIDWKTAQKTAKPLDGISLVKNLTNPQENITNNRILFSHWRGKFSARTQQYRYHHTGELFDIQSDPREKNDISKQNSEVATRLKRELDQFASLAPTSSNQPTRPFPIGHPDAEWTQLPARDATFTEGIKRSNRFPNCSYLLNWASTENVISWDVDVLAAGEYEVQMYYACPKQDVGSTIKLALAGQELVAKIVQPAESPIIGAEEDRVARQESYVRWWQPMTLGNIKLTPGRKPLTLQATAIPGSQVAEMRLLMLKRRGS